MTITKVLEAMILSSEMVVVFLEVAPPVVHQGVEPPYPQEAEAPSLAQLQGLQILGVPC